MKLPVSQSKLQYQRNHQQDSKRISDDNGHVYETCDDIDLKVYQKESFSLKKMKNIEQKKTTLDKQLNMHYNAASLLTVVCTYPYLVALQLSEDCNKACWSATSSRSLSHHIRYSLQT